MQTTAVEKEGVSHEGSESLGKPRRKTCTWTPELDEILKATWARGGLRAARRAIRQRQPTWSRYSVKKRAAELALCRRRGRAGQMRMRTISSGPSTAMHPWL
jgi:hypothetical protein